MKDQSVTLRGSQRFMDFPCIVACNDPSSNGSMSLEIMAPNSALYSGPFPGFLWGGVLFAKIWTPMGDFK